jgi:hypothetical protein
MVYDCRKKIRCKGREMREVESWKFEVGNMRCEDSEKKC